MAPRNRRRYLQRGVLSAELMMPTIAPVVSWARTENDDSRTPAASTAVRLIVDSAGRSDATVPSPLLSFVSNVRAAGDFGKQLVRTASAGPRAAAAAAGAINNLLDEEPPPVAGIANIGVGTDFSGTFDPFGRFIPASLRVIC